MRDANYMRSTYENSKENDVDKILNIIEEHAINGKSCAKVYIGSSDDGVDMITYKRRLLINELKKLGFDVASDFEVEWRFLISNLTKWYLKIGW